MLGGTLCGMAQSKARLAGRVAPLAAVPAAFALFVRANGGVVVGDRAAHAPVLHLVQPLYFALFAAGALAPALLTRRRCRLPTICDYCCSPILKCACTRLQSTAGLARSVVRQALVPAVCSWFDFKSWGC